MTVSPSTKRLVEFLIVNGWIIDQWIANDKRISASIHIAPPNPQLNAPTRQHLVTFRKSPYLPYRYLSQDQYGREIRVDLIWQPRSAPGWNAIDRVPLYQSPGPPLLSGGDPARTPPLSAIRSLLGWGGRRIRPAQPEPDAF